MSDLRMKSLARELAFEKEGKIGLNKIRLMADEKMAIKAGFALPPPLYTLGTPVNSIGEDNLRESRQKWEDLPLAAEVADSAAKMIREENRKDYNINPQNLKFVDGKLVIPGGESLGITRHAIQQLASMVAPRGSHAASYVSNVDIDIRDYAMNRHFQKPLNNKAVKLRTRQEGSEDRSIFAVVSSEFPSYDSNHVLESIRDVMDPRAKGVFKYSGDGGKMVFDVMYHSDISPSDAAAGEIFKVGLRVITADDGSSSYKVSLLAYRNLCLNLIIIAKGDISLLKNIHRGQAERIKESVVTKVVEGVSRLDGFATQWTKARKEIIPDFDNVETVEKMYLELLNRKILRIPGNAEKVAILLSRAWAEEKGNTKADLLNGVTRYARDNGWSPSQWMENSDIETSAGDLLYATVRWSGLI